MQNEEIILSNKTKSQEKTNPSSEINLNTFPESIIENEIFPFLSSKDLFYSVRGVSTIWYELMKNDWSRKIKEEMIDQVKSLDFIYEKEIYTKTYDFKSKFLINYRSLLLGYLSNANVLLICKSLLPLVNEVAEVKILLQLLFSFCEMSSALEELNSDNVEQLDLILNDSSTHLLFRSRMTEALNVETLEREEESVNIYKSNFSMLNKETLENISESAKLIYSFLQGLIEFSVLKLEVASLKGKIENLIHRIQEETLSWPRKKRFFEKAYKFLLYSKSTNEETQNLIKIYENNKIRHPIMDYNDEALRSVYELKERLTSGLIPMKEIDEQVFENILSRRMLLTKKILIMEGFSKIYTESKKNENEFVIQNEQLNLRQLLWSMKLSSNSNDKIDSDSILRTKSFLDLHFDYENNKQIEINQVDKLQIEKQNEISSLRKEKLKLQNQKLETEEILEMIKKFMKLKQHMKTNKNKYKIILYILSKVRKGEIENLSNERLNELIEDIDIDNFDFSEESVLSENEKSELNNFDSSDALMKDIEVTLMRRIESHLLENQEEQSNQENK